MKLSRSEKLNLDMLGMAKRLKAKELKVAIKKAREVEIPTEADLEYWLENSKTFLK